MLTQAWEFTSAYGLYQWYDHVRLADGQVIGQWLCLAAETGHCLWQRRIRRANTLAALTDDWLVATEMRSDGPWTADFGIYGIRRQTGELAWKSHRDGLLGAICNVLDAVPFLTNELRDSPKLVADDEVITRRGRVLDIKTGHLLRTQSPEQSKNSVVVTPGGDRTVATPKGDLKIATPTPQNHHRFAASFHEDGTERWCFDLETTGRFITGVPSSYRVSGSDLLLIVSEQPATVPIKPDVPSVVRRNSTAYELWRLSLSTGVVEEKVPVTKNRVEECRIEDVDGEKILVSQSNRQLICFSR